MSKLKRHWPNVAQETCICCAYAKAGFLKTTHPTNKFHYHNTDGTIYCRIKNLTFFKESILMWMLDGFKNLEEKTVDEISRKEEKSQGLESIE